METILLEKGAAKIITLEYANITVEHPNITIMSPQQLKLLYNEQKGPSFHAVVSFFSLEHSGLGRYGEALNPWGDLITMAKTWCLTKMGGKFLIGKQKKCVKIFIECFLCMGLSINDVTHFLRFFNSQSPLSPIFLNMLME